MCVYIYTYVCVCIHTYMMQLARSSGKAAADSEMRPPGLHPWEALFDQRTCLALGDCTLCVLRPVAWPLQDIRLYISGLCTSHFYYGHETSSLCCPPCILLKNYIARCIVPPRPPSCVPGTIQHW